jgi:menaquinone-specific isochorismate synthase
MSKNSSLKIAGEKLIEAVNKFKDQNGHKLISGDVHIIYRFEEKIESTDILSWLRAQQNRVKLYWRDRDGDFEVAGIGTAHRINCNESADIPTIIGEVERNLEKFDSRIRYYGGFCFNPNQPLDKLWKNFESFQFIIPEMELFRIKEEVFLAYNLNANHLSALNKSEIKNEQFLQKFDFQYFSQDDFEIISRIDEPNYDAWRYGIHTAFNLFSSNILKKVVMARRTSFEFSEQINPLLLLKKLKSQVEDAFHFYFQPGEGNAFFGASPERLYKRNGNDINTEAVAGTYRRSYNEMEDKKLEIAFLNSKKNIQEHSFVCEHIENVLSRYCNSVRKDDTLKILKTARLQHLYRGYQAKLIPGISNSEILSALHPTPAVGGVPTDRSLSEISKIEEFHRGWYAGPFGWIGKNSADFAVAIRSGIMKDNRLHLYSGAGILPESDPLAEWEEIENKIGSFINIIKTTDDRSIKY